MSSLLFLADQITVIKRKYISRPTVTSPTFRVMLYETEGYRGLAHHGGPPGWLEESDPAGVLLYVMDVPCRNARLFRTVSVALTGAVGIFSCCYIANLDNNPSRATSRKEGMGWCSSKPMPSLWRCPIECLKIQTLLIRFFTNCKREGMLRKGSIYLIRYRVKLRSL